MKIDDLFPGLTYFGAVDHDCLSIKLSAPVSVIKITLESVQPEIINLMAVKLFDQNGAVSLITTDIEITTSSVLQDDDLRYGSSSLKKGGGIHTKRELHPWIQIKLSVPRALSEIRLFNRADQYGNRSKTLVLSAQDSRGLWVALFQNYSIDRAFSYLSMASHYLSEDQLRCGLISKDFSFLRKSIKCNLIQYFNENPNSLERDDWEWLKVLLDLYDGFHVDDEDCFILAMYFANLILSNKPIGQPSIARTILNTARKLDLVETQIGKYLGAIGNNKKYSFSRHGLWESKLLSHKDIYISLAKKVMEHLKSMGVLTVLSYGTLLGAVREKGFIPHDDDMDVLYFDHAESQAEVLSKRELIIQSLKDVGYGVRELDGHLNFHVHDKYNDISIDIFPSWKVENSLFLYMEKMVIRAIPFDIVFPPSTIEFYEHEFSVPKSPELFLVARYGQSWNTPNKFFEWPYTIAE